MMKIFCALLVALVSTVLIADYTSAQTRFTPNRSNSLAAEFVYGQTEELEGIGGSLIYTANAKYDFALSYEYASYEDDALGPNGVAKGIIPRISVALVRPTVLTNFGAVLKASYEFVSFSSDRLTTDGTDLTGNAMAAGVLGYIKAQPTPELAIFPELQLDLVSATISADGPLAPTDDETVNDLAISAGLSLLYRDRIRVRPGFRAFDGETIWLLTVGLVNPLS